jgi:hypothetical protein
MPSMKASGMFDSFFGSMSVKITSSKGSNCRPFLKPKHSSLIFAHNMSSHSAAAE